MITRTQLTTASALVLLLIILAGCNTPRSISATPTRDVSGGGGTDSTPNPGDPLEPEQAVETTVAPVVSPTALPEPPSGWLEHVSPAMGIALYYPPDWEVIAFDAYHIDLRAAEGEGWIELFVVDSSNADDFSLAPEMVGDAHTIAEEQFAPLQENGEFSPLAPMETRTGASAYATQGTYDVLEDLLWVGVIDLGERAVIAQGHSLPDVEGWDTSLVPIYEQILWGITPVGE